MLDAGANAQPRGKADYMPLATAARRGSAEGAAVFHRLLDSGAKPTGPSFLSNVVECQQVDVVRRVLRDFPDVVSKASPDRLLELAAKRRDAELIRTLVEFGVRPSNRSDQPSPISGVIIGPPRSSVDFFAPEHINDPREIECLESLVAAGADVNLADRQKSVPLRWTIFFCRSELCRWLLEHGANPNAVEAEKSLVDYARKKLEEEGPRDYHNAEERLEQQRRQSELETILTMLLQAGGTSAAEFSTAASDPPRQERPPSRLKQSLDFPAKSVAERRGVCDDGFSKAEQIMIRADIGKIADVFAKDKKTERVERNVFDRLESFAQPLGDFLALVKLKGHDWVYVAGARRSRGDSPMKGWSKSLKAPVLCAGEQSTAGVVYYWLYDRGECVETFESDGQWFRGGVEIDPDVQDDSERMAGTDFSSQLRDPDSIDWSIYESEYDFLDKFLRDQGAYLTFTGVGFQEKGGPLKVWSYHEDEIVVAAVEQIDLVFEKPTPQQVAAAAQPDPKDDPLLQAVRAGDEAAVVAAIQAGQDVNALPPASDSSYLVIAIGHAIYGQSESIVDRLLEAGADPNNGGAEPALCRVANWSGSNLYTMRVMRRLIEAGADVNAREAPRESNPFRASGETPLMIVARSARLNYVKLLVHYGADLSIADSAGRTALDYATNWLREVKKDRLKDVPSFTHDDSLEEATATVDLLEALTEGTIDGKSLPGAEEILAAEAARLNAARR